MTRETLCTKHTHTHMHTHTRTPKFAESEQRERFFDFIVKRLAHIQHSFGIIVKHEELRG